MDKAANKLPMWKAWLSAESGRIILVKASITSMSGFHMMALEFLLHDQPPQQDWHGLLLEWYCTGRGQCMVAWDTICSSIEYGSLSMLNLKLLNDALHSK